MALHTKIKHIDTLPNGVLRFRRMFPQDVAEALDKPAPQVHIKIVRALHSTGVSSDLAGA